jgi:hypothetical protein
LSARQPLADFQAPARMLEQALKVRRTRHYQALQVIVVIWGQQHGDGPRGVDKSGSILGVLGALCVSISGLGPRERWAQRSGKGQEKWTPE